jgi:hypothetical protein
VEAAPFVPVLRIRPGGQDRASGGNTAFYRVRIDYCPHCGKYQSYLSLLPVLSDRWRCRGCRKSFNIDANAIGSNWACVVGLWSMPLTLLLAEVFIVVSIFQQHASVPMPNLFRDVVSPVLCGGPLVMVLVSFLFAIGGYFVGLIYGHTVTNRR